MPKKGSLVVVGTGIEALGQMTEAARREIRRAERLYYVADPLSSRAILAINPRGISLHDLYDKGKHRLRTYAQMTQAVLADVRQGRRGPPPPPPRAPPRPTIPTTRPSPACAPTRR